MTASLCFAIKYWALPDARLRSSWVLLANGICKLIGVFCKLLVVKWNWKPFSYMDNTGPEYKCHMWLSGLFVKQYCSHLNSHYRLFKYRDYILTKNPFAFEFNLNTTLAKAKRQIKWKKKANIFKAVMCNNLQILFTCHEGIIIFVNPKPSLNWSTYSYQRGAALVTA